tara:strand:- start:1147 stop:1407 length:261 start_codon:yes stop_codon:yes gene_type:complete
MKLQKKETAMFRIVQAKEIEGREKPLWLRIGTAFEKEGRISSLKLDVLPLPNQKGEVWLHMFKEEDKGSQNKSDGNFSDNASQAPW